MFRWPRIFTRNSNEDIESQIDDVNAVTVAIPSHPVMSSSNNILNSNLSGSFRDGDDDDVEQLMERNIYEPVQATTTPAEENQQHQSIAEPASSTSTQQRLGVAAIPNTQFCPTTPLSSRSNRCGTDDFAV